MDLGIKGRVAIVTGGSRGIGRETARQFLEEGVRVMISGRNAETIQKTRDELAKQTGGEIKCIVADMTKEADIKKLVDETVKQFGTVDILGRREEGMVRDFRVRSDHYDAAAKRVRMRLSTFVGELLVVQR